MKDPCHLLEAIVHEHFEFLLKERGYVILNEDSGHRDGCLIVLEGNSLRLKFLSARDEPLNVLVGDTSAPAGWADEVDGERKWHYLRGIAGYLDGDLATGVRVLSMSNEEWTEGREKAPHNLSSMLKAHIGDIENLFAGGGFDRVKADYEQYRKAADARTRAALESRAGRS